MQLHQPFLWGSDQPLPKGVSHLVQRDARPVVLLRLRGLVLPLHLPRATHVPRDVSSGGSNDDDDDDNGYDDVILVT